ncbi:hypothetical protein ABPG73_010462 [Tetrahymena malaccensis]
MNKCLPCSQNCSDCFNTGYDSCMSCASNFLVSYQNTSTCVSNCQQGENQTKNESCIKCLVEGCTKCDSNQMCLECTANLKLDLLNNKCIIQQGVCDSSLDFIYSPFTQNECVQSCPSSYYQNQKTQICEQINKCAQITRSSETLNQRVMQIKTFMQKYYIIRASGCYFALASQDFEIIDTQILQDFAKFDSQYSYQGQEFQQKSFIMGKYGGCTANYTLIVMNFETKQIVFQKSNLDQDYYVIYADNKNQMIFLSNQKNGIALYDVLNQQLNTNMLGLNIISGMFQFQSNNNTTYYFQISPSIFMAASLQDDRSLTLLNETLRFPSQLQLQQTIQNGEYIIAIVQDYISYQNSIYKLIQVNQTYFQTVLIQGVQMYQYQIYYSNMLNSIIQYDKYGYSLQILGLSQQSDQIDYSINLSQQTLNQFQIFENQQDNSTFAFFISDKLQFVNLTDYLIKFKNQQINLTTTLFQKIDSPFITNISTITNVIFQSNKIIEVFLSQVLQIKTQTYQQIRVQINLSESKFNIKYLDPNQNQKLFYIQNSSKMTVGQNQNMFMTKNQLDKNSFFIYDVNQVFLEQAIGVQKIKFNLQNLQKNPRINTRLINLKMQDDITLYDDILLISNQYLLLRKIVDYQINEYVIDISSQKSILTYSYDKMLGFSQFYYMKKRNLLIIQNIPQIFSLDTYLQIVQNPSDNNFSLRNFIVLNDDQIAYLSVNELNQSILYLVDFQQLKISQIFNFDVQFQLNFLTIDNNFTPIIAFNDLIYFCFSIIFSTTSTYTDCQPFSMSQSKLVYNLTRIQFSTFSSRSLIYQKTGDIFIFSENIIQIYSFDLSSCQRLILDVYYPNISFIPLALTYKEQYVFYFDQNYFVRFDMDLKSISQVKAQTDADLYSDQLIDFYQLDENLNYVKKSQSIIDTTNMITIKNQLNNFNYIGKLLIDDESLINCFYSEAGVFWYLNLFNNPYNVLNFTQYQLIQDNQLQNKNKILFYDKTNNKIIFYDITRKNEQQLFVSIDFSFDLQITAVDYEKLSYIWVKDEFIYFSDQQDNLRQQIIAQLDSKIVEYQYCFDQKIIVAKSAQQQLYSIYIQNQVKVNLKTPNQQSDVKFILNCEENIIIVYYPFIYIIDLKTGKNPDELNAVQQYVLNFYNSQQFVPIVNRQNQLMIIFYKQDFQFFNFNQFQYVQYLLNYKVNKTNLYYDIQNKILIGVTGNLKQINIINIPGKQQLFTYETINSFSKNAVYYSQVKNSLIVVDTTPTLYLCDYLSQNITNINIEINDIIGILMEENKNIVFLYSNQFILTYKFPSMQFIETISLQNYNDAYIQKVFLNTQLSIMTVQTLTHIISFDLTEILYASETNLFQYQKIQSLVLNQQYQVLYSTVNLSINLYQDIQLVDTLLIESFQQNIYPYLQQLILIQDNKFIFISYQTLNIIKADLQQNKLILQKKIKLNQMPDNYFYDKTQNKIFLLYEQNYQLSSLDLNIENVQEINLFSFKQGDVQQSIILSNYLVIPSTKFVQIYDLILNQNSQISLSEDSNIKFLFKLQSKNYEDYSTFWWEIPFDFEERYNNNDAQDQSEKLFCLVIQTKNNFNLQILNIDNKQISYTYTLNYSKIMNIVSDPFRKIIYLINDQGQTLVFTYKLELVVTLQNACLKQAKISYDQDFIYSICPNDILIFNGLSFQQQFPILNKGLSEVQNFVNTRYNNYFLVMQKNKFSVFKLEYNGNYEVIYEINEVFQLLLSISIKKQQQQIGQIELLLSSYKNVQLVQIPLDQNQFCFIDILQQNNAHENIFINIQLSQSLNSIQQSNQQLQLIQIGYSGGQCIQCINYDKISDKNINQNYQITLVSQSYTQRDKICWNDDTNFPQYIQNFYLKNMDLQINSSINLNQNKQMKYFQMQNVTLNLKNSLILSDFDQVLFQNITFTDQDIEFSQIIITNCKLIVIKQIQIINLKAQYSIFNITNNTKVILEQILVSKMYQSNIFTLNNNQQVNMFDFNILESENIKVIQIQQTDQIMVDNFKISKIKYSQIVDIQGCTVSQIQKINVYHCNQVQLISVNSFKNNVFQRISQNYLLQNMNLTSSADIWLNSQTEVSQFSNISINQFNISQDCFNIVAANLNISGIYLQNITRNKDNTQQNQIINQALFKISNYNDCVLSEINSFNNEIRILQINQLNLIGNTLIQHSKFLNSSLQNSLLDLLNIYNLTIYQSLVKNINLESLTLSSIIIIDKCNQVQIINSEFENNKNSNGYAGAAYLTDNYFVQIQNTKFLFNQCLSQNGGALSFININFPGNVTVLNSVFTSNQALFSTGGAINLINSNLILKNSTISSNKALIGGGIYYQQIIPDFILDLKQGILNSNIFSQNFASLYGKSIGSTLRSIYINLNDIVTSEKAIISENQNGEIQINQLKSGDQIKFNKIQLIDEENNPIQISNMNQNNSKLFSRDVQTIIDQLSVSILWDQQNQQIQCTGELQSKQFIDNGFNLDIQVMYKPLSYLVLQIASNSFSQLYDQKGNIYLQQGQLYKNITLYLDDCQLGQIIKNQGNSIYCEDCPEGKYSLQLSDSQCSICPDSAVKCFKSTIIVKNGYWRESNITDFIIYCSQNPEACQPESKQSIQYCAEGYQGPLCLTCDTYGEIIIAKLQAKLAGHFISRLDMIYLGSTLIQSDKPQIMSKILTDHIQIISLLSCFSINIPNYFNIPIQLFGNSLNVTSKSIDCVFSNYPSLKPLWFYQSLWSMALPISILLVYSLFGFFYKLLKNNNIILRYLDTACVFIYFYFFPMVITILSRSLNCIQIGEKAYLDLDVNIRCLDPAYHIPFIIYFSIPLLVFWVLAIPLFLFIKIRSGKLKQRSIFIQIRYSFIFAGYREKFYYWEFAKLVYKSILILISVLLQQNQILKICLMNGFILFQVYVTFRFKPYLKKNFNILKQQSAIICALSLNLTQILQVSTNLSIFQEYVIMIILLAPNLKFIFNLIMGILFIQIPGEIKRKIRMLVEFLKNHNIYGQESLQQHFSLQNTQQHTINSDIKQHHSSRFILYNLNEKKIKFKKDNSLKNMRDKWSYYTRNTKESLASKQNSDSIDTPEDKTKEIVTTESGGIQTFINDDQLVSDQNLNLNFKKQIQKQSK